MAINRTEAYSAETDEFSSEAIASRPTGTSVNTANIIQSGWDAGEKLARPSTGYTKEFKFTEGGFQVVKFLDENGPFAVYRQHFLKNKEGQKSYISLGTNDPLCVKLNSKPEEKRAFSIVNLSAEGGPQRQMLIASPRLWKSLHSAHFSPQGPLTKNYWALSRTGKQQTTTYHINAVKGRDLMEDWNIDEAVAEAVIAESKPFTAADLRTPTWEELEAIADSLLQ
jgi:hypothetical protein